MKIQFESTTSCNAKCTFCPRYEMTRPRGEMSDELFHKIIKDGIAMKRTFFIPFLNGEPFIFPRIWEWLDYMQEAGVPVHMYTNAELVDVDRLVKYKNIRLICCSVNAASPETHQKIMRGPDYERVVSNVSELIAKSSIPVYVSMVIVKDNEHEVDTFKEKWGKNSIFGRFINWGGAKHDPTERVGDVRYPCYSSLNAMTILWDGRVVVCCLDYDGKLVLGNANEEPLADIWQKSKWLREKHKALDYSMEPCLGCNQNVR